MNAAKRILNIFLIIFGVLLMILCADLITNKLAHTSMQSLGETDREAIGELCSMTALFDERYGNDEIWNSSYNLRSESFVITEMHDGFKGRTYYVNYDCPKSIFVQKLTMPQEYADIPVYRLSYFAPASFSYAKKDGEFIDIGGRSLFSVTFDKQSVMQNGTGSLEEACVKNTFAASVESADVPQRDETSHFELDEDNVALTGLQFRLIDDMLEADSKEQLNELIAEYVAVREYQAAHYPDFAPRCEQTELSDGCAQFVFYNISREIGHNITYFNKEEADSITFYSAYYYLCTGRYNSDVSEFLDIYGCEYTGAALCRIIDENQLVPNWESQIDGGSADMVSPYTLLKRYCEKECGEYSGKPIEDIQRAYNYEEIISMARTLVTAVSD